MMFLRPLLLTAVTALLLAGCTDSQQDMLYHKAIDLGRSMTGLTLHSADAGDVEMRYLERPGDGPVVVLLHGFSANKDTWLKFAGDFPAHYRLIIPDLAGHGDTPAPEHGNYNLIRQAERLHQLLAGIGISHFHLAGNSMGGAISAIYATRYPQQLQSLILIDAAGVDSPQPSEYMQALAAGNNPLIATDEASFEYRWNFTMSQPPSLTWPLRPAMIRATLARETLNREIFADMLATQNDISSQELEQQLREKATMPALIIWGEQDRVLDPSSVSVFKAALPQAEVKTYPGIGHLPMVEIPQETANLISRFIAATE